MKKKIRYAFLLILLTIFFFALPELLHTNKGLSHSKGSVSNGHLENAYLIPYKGPNYKYFSFTSYYLMNNGYMHSNVLATVLSAYQYLATSHPKAKFYVMECSDKHGGRLRLHKTHQNGVSIDFMSPKKSTSFHPKWNGIGLLHYLLEFNSTGQLSFDEEVEIDFELMAQHILALQKAGKKNGVRIKMVILKLNLKDDLFKTKSGKKLKASGIYFAQSLDKWTDKMHDDHYHIDFELIK